MKKIVYVLVCLLLTSCSLFNKKIEVLDGTGAINEKLSQTQSGGTIQQSNSGAITATGVTTSTGAQTPTEVQGGAKTLSDIDYEYVTKKGCNLNSFVFEDEKMKESFVGLTFTNILILRSKTPKEFKCFKLDNTIIGTNVGIIDDYGEERKIENIKLSDKGLVVIPEQAGFTEFFKTRHFVALEQKLGSVFEGFFYPEQLKNIKINTLGIAVFRKDNGELTGYEFSTSGNVVPSSSATELVECMEKSPIITKILDDKGVVLEGIFRELEGKIDVKGTVLEYPRFYHSFINFYYLNDLKNHPERFENDCIKIYK